MAKINKQLLISLIIISSFILLLSYTKASANDNNQAATTMKEMPQKYLGTWYHYNGKDKYNIIKFGKKYEYEKTYDTYHPRPHWDKYYATIHYHKYNYEDGPYGDNSNHPNWDIIFSMRAHHSNWINFYGWNQGAGDGTFYKIFYPKYNGQNIETLSEADGAGIFTYDHYYRSKQIAKQLGNHHFKGQIYEPS